MAEESGAMCLVIEGPPGAGKSYTVKALQSKFRGAHIYEEDGHRAAADGEESPLDLWLRNQKETTAMFQMHMLASCTTGLKKMMERYEHVGGMHIVDRGLWGNATFALRHHMNKLARPEEAGITTTEFALYRCVYEKVAKECMQGISVFFYTTPENCIRRIRMRGNKGEIEAYTPEYIGSLFAMDFLVLLSLLSRPKPASLLVYDNSADDPDVASKLVRALAAFHASPEPPFRLHLSHEACAPDGEFSERLDFADSPTLADFMSFKNAARLFEAVCFKSEAGSPSRTIHVRLPACVRERPLEGPFFLTIH